MTSRERVLTAIACQEPDHVPLVFRTFLYQPPAHLAWKNALEKAERWLSLGLDDIYDLYLGAHYPPEVKVRSWREERPGERYPLMVTEYETPGGTLHQEVYATGEVGGSWPIPTEARLMDDYNVPRFKLAPVRGEADLAALRYLLQPPEGEALAAFREWAAESRAGCDKLGVLMSGWGPLGTDALVWLCGVENGVLMAMDQPGVFEELLDLIHEHDKRLTEILLDCGVELIVRRGFYDHTGFWSPEIWRKYFAPRLRELTEMVHQAGRLMSFTMSTGMMPVLDTLTEIGYDLHWHVDPVQGGANMRKIKATLGQRTAVLGGMNSAVTLERGTDAEIRRAVHEAVAVLGPGGGLILSPVDCLFLHTPWHSLEVVMEAWREVRDYG